MKKIKRQDLINYRFLSQICCSPYDNEAAFMVNKQSLRGNTYEGNIYVADLDTGNCRAATDTNKEKSFLWDGPSILLCSEKSKEMPDGTGFFRLNLKTGERSKAFSLPYPVNSILKMGKEGSYIINATVDLNKKEGLTKAQQKEEEDYIQIDELPFWDNGAGYISRLRDSLFLYDETANEMTKLTDKLFQTQNAIVYQNYVFYTGQVYSQMRGPKNGLYRYDTVSKQHTTIVEQNIFSIGALQIAGNLLYFTATPMDQRGDIDYEDIYLCIPESLEYHKIADNDFTIGCTVSSDCRFGSGSSTGELSGKFAYLTTEGAVCNLNLMDEKGNLTKLPAFDGSIDCFSTKGQDIVMICMADGRLSELYCYHQADGSYTQLSSFNEAALEGCYVAEPEYTGFTNSDGVTIDGWVLKPIHYSPLKSYPGVLSMHGGPCGAWGKLFVHEMQMLASEGYFVFFCNPRGSDGRGAEFADLRGKYGSIDYCDFMEFTDHVLAVFPQLDSRRLGAIGGSYGGYMANWIVGHTDRFGAVVSQRSFCNPISDFGVSCIGYSFDSEQFAATPWSDVMKLWDHAPLKYADKAVTPTLFIHSLEDYNCPLTEGFQMFSALKYHGVESRMCLFKGENHELSRSGKPKHRLRRLSEIQGWLDSHLK